MTPTQEQNPAGAQAGAGRPKTYLTVAQAVEHSGASRSTIYRWVREGRLTAYKRGTAQTWFDRDELDDIIRPRPANPNN